MLPWEKQTVCLITPTPTPHPGKLLTVFHHLKTNKQNKTHFSPFSQTHKACYIPSQRNTHTHTKSTFPHTCSFPRIPSISPAGRAVSPQEPSQHLWWRSNTCHCLPPPQRPGCPGAQTACWCTCSPGSGHNLQSGERWNDDNYVQRHPSLPIWRDSHMSTPYVQRYPSLPIWWDSHMSTPFNCGSLFAGVINLCAQTPFTANLVWQPHEYTLSAETPFTASLAGQPHMYNFHQWFYKLFAGVLTYAQSEDKREGCPLSTNLFAGVFNLCAETPFTASLAGQPLEYTFHQWFYKLFAGVLTYAQSEDKREGCPLSTNLKKPNQTEACALFLSPSLLLSILLLIITIMILTTFIYSHTCMLTHVLVHAHIYLSI